MRKPLKAETIEAISRSQIPVTTVSPERAAQIALKAAQNRMARAVAIDDGDMWARGWEYAKELMRKIGQLKT